MKKQEFIRRYNDIRDGVIKTMDEALTRAIGNEVIDLEKCVGNYLDIYPLIGAALQRELFTNLNITNHANNYRNSKAARRKCSPANR